MNDAVRVAKEATKQEAIRMVRDVLVNPVVGVIGGVILVEYLQSHVENGQRVAGGGWMGSNVGTALETTLGGYLLLNDVQKLAPAIGDITKALAPIIPMVIK